MKRVLMAASLAFAAFGLGSGPMEIGANSVQAAPGAFGGTYTGTLTLTIPPIGFSHPQSFQGTGQGAVLGESSLAGSRDGIDLCDSILYSGLFSNDNFFVLSKNASNSITLEYHIASCEPESGTFTVVAGTGRFAGAQGTGMYGLSSSFVNSSTDQNTGVSSETYTFRLTLIGSLDTPRAG